MCACVCVCLRVRVSSILTVAIRVHLTASPGSSIPVYYNTLYPFILSYTPLPLPFL